MFYVFHKYCLLHTIICSVSIVCLSVYIHPVLRGTLQTYMKRTLRTPITQNNNLWITHSVVHVGFEPHNT